MSTTDEEKEKVVFRYSPQAVTRRAYDSKTHKFEVVATYDDATVRDNGRNGWTDAPEAMLRAYNSDPNFFGDEDYQSGNGISVWTQEDEERFIKQGYAPGHHTVGAVYDCDGDLALKRVMMNAVLSTYNYGHGCLRYTGFVGWEEKHQEYGGFGGMDKFRLEQWDVYVPNEEGDE